MNRQGHQAFARFATLSVGMASGINPATVIISGLVASQFFSHGKLSPDADQTWLKFLGHRKGTHKLWIPATSTIIFAAIGAPYPLTVIPLTWISHLVADMICGKAGYGRGRGIEIAGKWVGVGLKTGGKAEHMLTKMFNALAVIVAIAGIIGYATR